MELARLNWENDDVRWAVLDDLRQAGGKCARAPRLFPCPLGVPFFVHDDQHPCRLEAQLVSRYTLPCHPTTDPSLFSIQQHTHRHTHNRHTYTTMAGPPLVPRMVETAERVLGVARRREAYATEEGEDGDACWPPAVWGAMEVRDVGTRGGGDSEV